MTVIVSLIVSLGLTDQYGKFNKLMNCQIWLNHQIRKTIEKTVIMVRFSQSKSLDPYFLDRKIDLATQNENLTTTRPVN